MRIIKKCFKWLFYVFLIPIFYVLISLALSIITVNNNYDEKASKAVYLSTNGVHLDIIIPSTIIDSTLQKGLIYNSGDKYLSFGWGDKNFYLNTPTWGDLTVKNALSATLLNSDTLIHLTKYKSKQDDWVEVKLTNSQLEKLNNYILKYFKIDDNGSKIILAGKGYTDHDDFYEAHGNYSILKTCNTWVNSALKESDLKACLWTPFDFTVLNKYKNQ